MAIPYMELIRPYRKLSERIAWHTPWGMCCAGLVFISKCLKRNCTMYNDASEEFEKYVKVFKSSERKISYLAPLEYVSFEQR